MAQSDAQSIVGKWCRKSHDYSLNSNDALVTSLTKGFETILAVLSKTPDSARIKRCLTSLDHERKLALQFEKNELDIIRHLSFGLIESLQVLLQVMGNNIEERNQTLVNEGPITSLTVVEPKEEPNDPIDELPEDNQMPIVDDLLGEPLFKEEEIDFDFEVNNDTLPIEQPLNELLESDNDSHKEIMDNHNSTLMEKESLNNLSSGETAGDSAYAEMVGESNDLKGEKEGNSSTVHQTTDTTKNTSGEVKKIMRPTRTRSRPARYTEFIDETESLEKKPRIKSEKKVDNTIMDESPSNSFAKGSRLGKINVTELECPNYEYRSLSVYGWCEHLKRKHSTTPRELGLALLRECGDESYSETHSRKCEISKITAVRKTPTPKCVMCEMYPRTASGYARHLADHHKTTLKQIGMILVCSCGYKIRALNSDPEHTKKCNGHDYTLHNVDDEE